MSHIESVQVYRRLIESLLAKAEELKLDKQIEPPLTETDFGDSTWRIEGSDANVLKRENQQANYAAVETAFREKFYDLLATTSIDDPSFVQIWHLLDVVSIFSDNEQCEPGLIFWLIEELLDSQTIDGCRKVFDYLESRRERNTAKHFKQKSLIILRSCNELLRRLSRAEDTVFCGRVFIYLFQSFPLGDKSSVNLRGEYHTENVTTFDEVARETQKEQKPEGQSSALEEDEPKDTVDASVAPTGDDSHAPKDVTPKAPGVKLEKDAGKEPVDLDTLYPIFWGLQAFFSAPTRLFDPENFASFKGGLEATLSAFKRTNTDIDPRSGAKGSDEAKRGTKRKRATDGSEVTSSFNPKYLTSRDLFNLEISDIAFRRHVLVQALIILDFLLSLTPKAKSKLADLTNKSVLYNFVLNDDDAKWATNIRHGIEGYLQEGVGGKFYYRMVDNVLSRDKNWIRWKAEGCPLIERPAVSVKDYLDARETAAKTYANKRIRPSPMGSLDLKFLSDAESLGSLERLKEPDRFSKPAPDSLMMGIVDDDFDLDMAQTKEDKDNAMRSKASKIWRTLRLSAKSKMNQFDKIEDGKNIKVLFETPSQPEEPAKPSVESTNNAAKADTEPKGDDEGNDEKENDDKENNTNVDQPMADAKAEDSEKTTEAPA